MPYISSDKKKSKLPQGRKTRFLDTIDRFLSKAEESTNMTKKEKNETASKVHF